VNSLFFQSIKKGASDIHIESHENRGEVRIRIDGALKKHIDLDRKITTLVINPYKSNLKFRYFRKKSTQMVDFQG